MALTASHLACQVACRYCPDAFICGPTYKVKRACQLATQDLTTCRTRGDPDEGIARPGMPQTPSTSHLGLALDGQPLDGAGSSGRPDLSSVGTLALCAGGDGVAQRLAVLKQRGGGRAGAAPDIVSAYYPSGGPCSCCRAGRRR